MQKKWYLSALIAGAVCAVLIVTAVILYFTDSIPAFQQMVDEGADPEEILIGVPALAFVAALFGVFIIPLALVYLVLLIVDKILLLKNHGRISLIRALVMLVGEAALGFALLFLFAFPKTGVMLAVLILLCIAGTANAALRIVCALLTRRSQEDLRPPLPQ